MITDMSSSDIEDPNSLSASAEVGGHTGPWIEVCEEPRCHRHGSLHRILGTEYMASYVDTPAVNYASDPRMSRSRQPLLELLKHNARHSFPARN